MDDSTAAELCGRAVWVSAWRLGTGPDLVPKPTEIDPYPGPSGGPSGDLFPLDSRRFLASRRTSAN